MTKQVETVNIISDFLVDVSALDHGPIHLSTIFRGDHIELQTFQLEVLLTSARRQIGQIW
jgi:hypothetical protein